MADETAKIEEEVRDERLGVKSPVANPSPFRPTLGTLKVTEVPLPQDWINPNDSPHHV